MAHVRQFCLIGVRKYIVYGGRNVINANLMPSSRCEYDFKTFNKVHLNEYLTVILLTKIPKIVDQSATLSYGAYYT